MIPFIVNPDKCIASMKHKQNWNLERIIKHHLKNQNVPIRLIPYTMFAIRLPDGTTRWSRGTFDSENNYYIKYKSERAKAKHFEKSKNAIIEYFYEKDFQKSTELKEKSRELKVLLTALTISSMGNMILQKGYKVKLIKFIPILINLGFLAKKRYLDRVRKSRVGGDN